MMKQSNGVFGICSASVRSTVSASAATGRAVKRFPSAGAMLNRGRGEEREGRFIMCSRCSSHLSALLWNAVELIRLHLRQV